ncbi:MAG: Rne/Rng family ribonuclease [Paracoccaceae bacterium]
MVKKMLIDATHAEETRVVVVDGNKVEEFDFETLSKRQIAGNIYLAKVTRVEPSLQAAFVDYGGNRHGFLAFSEIHFDYYQIPPEDRRALLEEERALVLAENEGEPQSSPVRRPRNDKGRLDQTERAERTVVQGEILQAPVPDQEDVNVISETQPDASGMEVLSLDQDYDPVSTSIEIVSLPSGASNIDAQNHQAHGHDYDYNDLDHETGHKDHTQNEVDEIESIADEDVVDEIAPTRKSRVRRYKIQEVIKMRQIMLVQVVKEERGNKGAALTTYLSLAGRYCVLMPNTSRGGGISRKITLATDRKKLKAIVQDFEVPEGAGVIIRTAGANRTKPEIRRDYEYLMRLWEQVRELTLKSVAPAAIYEEGDLIKRSIRDLYNREIDEVLVEGEAGYRIAKDFMRMIMPSHVNVVRFYSESMPLFVRFQVESYISGMFNPTVQLKSGGYIVIGVTEALVAIDVNSGRATKEGSIEDTALKTNLEAAEEVARQSRLRDLAGLIVIDFIDMDERRNNISVEKRIKDRLKTDRARIQVGRISGFGLLEMSRQRLRPGMLESTTQPCSNCHGTGLIRSDDSLALQILRALEEEGARKKSKEVLLKAPVTVINFLMNQKREHIARIEARYGISVRIEADPHLVSPDYVVENFKFATRFVSEMQNQAISGTSEMMGDPVSVRKTDFIEDAIEAVDVDEAASETVERDENIDDGKKKRRRRRRRRGAGNGANEVGADASSDYTEDAGKTSHEASDVTSESTSPSSDAVQVDGQAQPIQKTRTRSRGPKPSALGVDVPQLKEVVAIAIEAVPSEVAPTPTPPAKRASTRKPSVKAKAVTAKPEAILVAETEVTEALKPKSVPRPRKTALRPAAAPEAANTQETVALNSATSSHPPEVTTPEVVREGDKSKRKGWWNLGS